MQCFGRTSLKNRCKNPARFLVCKNHYMQALLFIAVTLPAIYASYSTIYKDIRPDSGETIAGVLDIDPFPEDDHSFKILILPFDPLEGCQVQKTDMGKAIYKRLVALREKDSLDISLRYETSEVCPAGFEEGRSVGKRLNADLVLWGETYERCQKDSLEACLRYVLLSGEKLPLRTRGSSGIQSLASMSDISEGYLQKDIDYVVFWTLGSEAYAQGRYGTAVKRFEKVYRLRPDDPEILNWYGLSLHLSGQYGAAEPLFRRTLAISEAQLGPNHPYVATGLNNLAVLLQDQGKYSAAEPLYRRALAISEASLGPNHPDVAGSLNNLANLLQHQGKTSEAEPLYRRALAIKEASLGPTHPGVATSLANLGSLLEAQGKYEEAEPLLQRALAIREASLGPKHPGVARSLNNLAALLWAQGMYKEAEPLCRRALAISEASLGSNHPAVATSLNNLALLLQDQGNFSAAEPLYRRALAISEASLGPKHPDVATSLNNLAGFFYEQGKYTEAEPLFRQALKLREVSLGSNHPDVAQSLNTWLACSRIRARPAKLNRCTGGRWK